MKQQRILTALNGIDDNFVTEAVTPLPKMHRTYFKFAAVAVASLVAVFGLWYFNHLSQNAPDPGPDNNHNANSEYVNGLKVLPLPDSVQTGSMGYEGYEVYRYDELKLGNPWNPDIVINTMPVYQYVEQDVQSDNGKTIAEAYFEKKAAREEVEALIRQRLVGFDNAVVKVPLGYNISQYWATVYFDPPETVPDSYNTDILATYEETKVLGEYLLANYGQILGMKKPAVAVVGGNYSFYEEGPKNNYHTRFYDADGDIVQQIFSYSNELGADIYVTEKSEVEVAQVHEGVNISLIYNGNYKSLGDYPILTYDQALQKLYSGGYFDNMLPDDMVITKDLIAAVELIYVTDRYNTRTIMPYYKFYVENTSYQSMGGVEGMKQLIPCYIPALLDEYYTNLPQVNGIPFN